MVRSSRRSTDRSITGGRLYHGPANYGRNRVDPELGHNGVTERSNAAGEERLKPGHAVGGVSII
jgi:hypothetical protein